MSSCSFDVKTSRLKAVTADHVINPAHDQSSTTNIESKSMYNRLLPNRQNKCCVKFIIELVFILISISFFHLIAQEGFDYVYRTVNKPKRDSNKPSQEIGNPQPSKTTSATHDKCTDNSSNDPTSTTLDERKCE